jgi:hypothetical protein
VTVSAVHSGISQTTVKFQLHRHSKWNSNDVLENRDNYNGTDTLNPIHKSASWIK